MKRYSIIPHTADVRIKIAGRDWPELFENAALGLVEGLMELGPGSGGGKIAVKLEAEDAESLLVGWLNELIYIVQTRGVIPSSMRVTRCDGKRLEAVITGKHRHGKLPAAREIKAATYNELRIMRKEKILGAAVLFDV